VGGGWERRAQNSRHLLLGTCCSLKINMGFGSSLG